MNKTYPITVENGRNETYRYRRKLRRFGLFYAGDDAYSGAIPEKRISAIKSFCKTKRLAFRIDNEYGRRSSDYRKVFFQTHKPLIGGIYLCAYCGRPLTRKRLTVDHIYPVGRSKESLKAQKRLKKQGYSGINDPKNLVAACETCNKRKGKNTGTWIIRGKIGQHQKLWIIRWILRLLLIAFIVYIIYSNIRISEAYAWLKNALQSF